MIYTHEIDGLSLRTGDLICTTDGASGSIIGQYWRLVGKLIPGEVDHIVVYVGPGGRCVEAGAKFRVITFNVKGGHWDAMEMRSRRGGIVDTLYGVSYPLEDKDLTDERERTIREGVARYCLKQAELKKPYNLNFLNSKTEKKFYCSQLAYKAYLRYDIDLNTGVGVPRAPGTDSVIYPQEIWSGCVSLRA